MIDTSINDTATLRSLIVLIYDTMIADLTSQAGYSIEAVDQLTRMRWRVAAADLDERREVTA